MTLIKMFWGYFQGKNGRTLIKRKNYRVEITKIYIVSSELRSLENEKIWSLNWKKKKKKEWVDKTIGHTELKKESVYQKTILRNLPRDQHSKRN